MPSIVTVPPTPLRTPKRASSNSFWPCPSRPPRPRISPRPADRLTPRRRFSHGEILDLQQRRRARPFGLRGELGFDVAADHQGDDLVRPFSRPSGTSRCGARCGTPSRSRQAPRSRACDARCRGCRALSLRRCEQHPVDPLDVRGGEGGGRLVEDEELRVRGRAPWRSRPSGGGRGRGPARAPAG